MCIHGYRVDDADIDGHVHHHPNLVQQLNLELSQKKMIFSTNHIQVSKVVGQGSTLLYIYCAYPQCCSPLLCTGESGLVYCGYLDSVSGRDIVAIKTCKG